MDKDLKVGKPIAFDNFETSANPVNPLAASPDTVTVGKKSSPNAANLMRVALIVVIIVALSAVTGVIALYVMKEEEITKRIAGEKKLQETQTGKEQVESKLRRTEQEKTQLTADIEQSREQNRLIAKQLSDKEAEHKELQAMFDQKMNEIFTLKTDYEKQTKDVKMLEQKLERLNVEYEESKVQLGQIRMAKEALENRIIQMSKKARPAVDLEEVVVTGASGSAVISQLPPPAKLEGQVLVVNKEFAFVVINLGQRDGLKESHILEVYRGTQFLGKVKVERIYDTMSSAVLLADVAVGDIKEGDIVKLI